MRDDEPLEACVDVSAHFAHLIPTNISFFFKKRHNFRANSKARRPSQGERIS